MGYAVERFSVYASLDDHDLEVRGVYTWRHPGTHFPPEEELDHVMLRPRGSSTWQPGNAYTQAVNDQAEAALLVAGRRML